MGILNVNKAYSSPSWWYDLRGLFILYLAYRSSLWRQIKFFAQNVSENHLEVAIGSGSLFFCVMWYRRLFGYPSGKVDGFDFADKMVVSAKRNLRFYKNIHIFKANASNTGLKDGSYTSVNIANAFHCLPEIDKTLKELNRVLSLGGVFSGNCLLNPTGESFLDKISCQINRWGQKRGLLNRPYSKHEILDGLKDNGFQLIHEKTDGNCLYFISEKVVSR